MSNDQTGRGNPKALLTFDDIVQDLVWPRLLRAGVLAFHPARLAVSLLLIGVVAGFVWFLLWVETSLGWNGSAESQSHLSRLLAQSAPAYWFAPSGGERMIDLFFAVPVQLIRVHPLAMIVGGPICLLLSILVLGAISRTAATEFAAGRSEPMGEALGFARQRLASMAGAVLGPVVLVWVIAIVLAVGGFLFLRWPGVNLVGSALCALALVVGLFAMFLLFVYIFGKPLLIPGVCCDGSDALDAIQRAYAYVLAKPLRLVVYFAILAMQGFILLTLVSLLCAATVAFTARATGKWAGEEGQRMAHAERAPERAPADGVTEMPLRDRLFNSGASVIRAWNGFPAAIPLAFLFSYSACAATLLYLAMRRICDGQDMNELWSPREDRAGALGAGAVPTDTDADAE